LPVSEQNSVTDTDVLRGSVMGVQGSNCKDKFVCECEREKRKWWRVVRDTAFNWEDRYIFD
jgi:hypothetical protein